MADNTQTEALRLATASNAMADEGVMIHRLSWTEIRNLLRANAAELRRLHALTAQQQRDLIAESHRTAEQKLRADQMTTQHAHQAALNTEARAQLAAALTAQAISKAPDHIAEVGNMVAQAISAEPAGAGYAALPDAKTLGEAVAAWIGVETRGAHNWVDTTVDRLGFAVRSVMGDVV